MCLPNVDKLRTKSKDKPGERYIWMGRIPQLCRKICLPKISKSMRNEALYLCTSKTASEYYSRHANRQLTEAGSLVVRKPIAQLLVFRCFHGSKSLRGSECMFCIQQDDPVSLAEGIFLKMHQQQHDSVTK